MPIITKMVKVSPFFAVAISSPDNDAQEQTPNPETTQKDKVETCTLQPPFQICKPLVLTMASFGLLYLTHKKWTYRKWVSAFSKRYSVVVLILMWLNFFRFFSVYSLEDAFGPTLFLKIIIHVWYLLGTINCTVNFKACGHDNGFREFLSRWLDLVKMNRGINADVDKERSDRSYAQAMSRRVFTFLLIGWLLFLMNNIFSAYLMFATSLLDITISPIPPDHVFAFTARCIVFVFHVYISASWIFTLCLFFLVTSAVYREFEIFQQDFRLAISTDSKFRGGIEIFRRRHQLICRIVETADDTLSVFNITGLGLNICIGMLQMYNIVWYEYDPMVSKPLALASSIFWLVPCFAYLCVIAFGGGYLSHMAHAPLKSIHDIRVDQTSPEFSLQMNIFLNRLTGKSIGLTAMDMFVIDKTTILTFFDR